MKILISACLLGERVKYDGGHNRQDHQLLREWLKKDLLALVCPETLGGLPTPREPAEIQDGDGEAVLDGQARILTVSGQDVTTQFLEGARATLNTAKTHGATMAVLKARSPSCGNEIIYDGSFQGMKTPGAGVTAALLKRHGVAVFNEDQIQEAADWLAKNPGNAD